jgi:hypothetical protein
MSKIMILPAPGVWPMLEYELDFMDQRLAEGHQVVWLMCQGDAPFCPANIEKKKRICIECQSRTRNGLRWLEHRESLTVGSLYTLDDAQRTGSDRWARSVNPPDELSPLELPSALQHMDWYTSAYSTLQTTLKEFQPDLQQSRQLLQTMILDFFQSHLAFENNARKHQPDEVWLFNGRITRYRPALRSCQQSSKRVFVYEYPYQGFKRPIIFEGQYVHDFGFRSRTWKRQFAAHPLATEKKIAIGDSWYQKRLARIQTNYEKVFSAYQKQGELPPDWDPNRRNVAIFNSSEWEAAGVPESRRWNYEDQYSAIEQVLRDSQHIPNLHFTFRIHPHMAKKDKQSAARFMTLSRFPNVTVLPPESKFDTYALAMASDVVLTFYSLVGIESAWLGHPVICLGPCPYQDFGSVYLPKSHAELIETLSSPQLAEQRFPSAEMRKRGAQEFAFARLFSGTRTRHLVKTHYTRAQMRRGSKLTKIRAARPILIFNRVVSLPAYLLEALRRVSQDEFLRREIRQNPWLAIRRFVRDRIGGLVP